MLPGESPLAFFLRTQASDDTKKLADEAQATEVGKKDAFWQAGHQGSRVDFLFPGAAVGPVEGRGRGLVASERVPVGAVVLRERAVAAAAGSAAEDAEQPLLPACRLAAAVLAAGLEAATNTLEPRTGRELAEHPIRSRRKAELARGRARVREQCPVGAARLDDDALDRLLMVMTLNAIGVVLPGGQLHQGLFAEVGAMVNHSSRPNLVFHGAGVSGKEGYDELQLVLQAVRDVEPGEELTISYLPELYLPHPERDERLQELYGFPADRLPSDAGLEAQVPNAAAGATQRVVAANDAAHGAWERVAVLRGLLTKVDDEEKQEKLRKQLQQQQMTAAQHYAAILNEKLLAETHAWRYNATWRLAALLTNPGAPKSCAKALPLWEAAMRSGLHVWPSEHWPEHRRLLAGARRAAEGAGDGVRAAEIGRQLEALDGAMAPPE